MGRVSIGRGRGCHLHDTFHQLTGLAGNLPTTQEARKKQLALGYSVVTAGSGVSCGNRAHSVFKVFEQGRLGARVWLLFTCSFAANILSQMWLLLAAHFTLGNAPCLLQLGAN